MAISFKTKNEAIYEELKKDILQGKLKPGEKIIMSEVAKQFGLSEIPIREAIRRLETGGLREVASTRVLIAAGQLVAAGNGRGKRIC